MKRCESSTFVAKVWLKTNSSDEYILNKRFNIGCHIQNSFINIQKKKLNRMLENKIYRRIFNNYQKDFKNKDYKKQYQEMLKNNGFSEFNFSNEMTKHYKVYNKNIDSNTAQNIANRVWVSFEKYFFNKGKYIHYVKNSDFVSLCGKTNKSGIKIKDNLLYFNSLKIRLNIKEKDYYLKECFENRIKFVSIKRIFIKNKYRYQAIVFFEGTPPKKYNKDGESVLKLGKGNVGLDIGTSTIAIASNNDVKLYELADKVENIEKQKELINRKLNRSRRATNPDNFNEDGTIKLHGNKKLVWNKSKKYIKLQHKLKDLYRKQAYTRKLQHEQLANEIISKGDNFNVEQMSFQGLQKRALKTEKNDKGKFKRKSRFGKTLANRSPAMLLTIIDRKLHYFDKSLNKINTQVVKASQYNQETDDYQKKSLGNRKNVIYDSIIQRDLYSAYIIKNVNNDLKTLNKESINNDFNTFKTLHDKEIIRLKVNSTKLSCVGLNNF